jgi:hypothetical protein
MLLAMGLSLASTAGVSVDSDGDGAPDNSDNCTLAKNANGMSEAGSSCVAQEDDDGDAYGNACDNDLDQDNNVLTSDLTAALIELGNASPANGADVDCDGTVLTGDLTIILAGQGGSPGPSGFNP